MLCIRLVVTLIREVCCLFMLLQLLPNNQGVGPIHTRAFHLLMICTFLLGGGGGSYMVTIILINYWYCVH